MSRILVSAVFVIALSAISLTPMAARAQGACDSALVLATYKSFDRDHLDWRLAVVVTESEYEQIKREGGANARIFGVSLGASFQDFQERLRKKRSERNESLTRDQIRNVLWTGLDPNSPNAYSQCLQTQLFSSRGLHLAVGYATESDIALIVGWNPQGTDRSSIPLKWTGQASKGLPANVTAGQMTVIVKRPKTQQTLAVNYPGFTGAVVLNPLPPPPAEPQVAKLVNTVRQYLGQDKESGRCADFSGWYTHCTAEEPPDWKIVSHVFQLQGDRRCGSWANCKVTVNTPTRICYDFQLQGHSEECGRANNTGIKWSKGQLDVTWSHPE